MDDALSIASGTSSSTDDATTLLPTEDLTSRLTEELPPDEDMRSSERPQSDVISGTSSKDSGIASAGTAPQDAMLPVSLLTL